jgi:vitamin-K-epoxide reductase (warfarin-sensitive)
MVSASAVIVSKLRRLRSYFAFFCFAGIALSSYAFYVETKKEHDDSYVAMCDISESMSCSKVFSSKYSDDFLVLYFLARFHYFLLQLFRYGKGFGLLQYVLDENSPLIQPNPVYGAIFYGLVLLLGISIQVRLEKCSLTLIIDLLDRTWKLFTSGQGSDVAVYHGQHWISLFGLHPVFCS